MTSIIHIARGWIRIQNHYSSFPKLFNLREFSVIDCEHKTKIWLYKDNSERYVTISHQTLEEKQSNEKKLINILAKDFPLEGNHSNESKIIETKEAFKKETQQLKNHVKSYRANPFIQKKNKNK